MKTHFLSSKDFNSPLLFVAGTLKEKYLFSNDACLFMHDYHVFNISLLLFIILPWNIEMLPHVDHLAQAEVGCLSISEQYPQSDCNDSI